jgi:hypothetical protein
MEPADVADATVSDPASGSANTAVADSAESTLPTNETVPVKKKKKT